VDEIREVMEGEGDSMKLVHPLFCLTDRQFSRIKGNSVVLRGFQRDKKKGIMNGITHFQEVEHIGENVSKIWNKSNESKPCDLRSVKKQFVCLIGYKREVADACCFFVGASDPESKYVCLLVASYKKSGDNVEPINVADLLKKCRASKTNIISSKTTAHFDSTGEYYSFGIGPKFDMKDGVSFGEYACKKDMKSPDFPKFCEDMLISQIIDSSSCVNKVIPGIVQATTMTLQSMEKMCKVVCDAKGKPIRFQPLSKQTNFISGNINFNAKTGIPHTERDLVYTLIGVPKQDKEVSLKFQFYLTKMKIFNLLMVEGIHFLYSAHLLTHNQSSHKSVVNGNLNISAYTAKQLFHNFAETLHQPGNEMCEDQLLLLFRHHLVKQKKKRTDLLEELQTFLFEFCQNKK